MKVLKNVDFIILLSVYAQVLFEKYEYYIMSAPQEWNLVLSGWEVYTEKVNYFLVKQQMYFLPTQKKNMFWYLQKTGID